MTWGEMGSENAILRVAYLLNSPKGHALFHTIIFRFVHCSCLTRVLVRQLAKFYCSLISYSQFQDYDIRQHSTVSTDIDNSSEKNT